MKSFVIKPDAVIRWSRRGSCGNAGCADPDCCCGVCHKPIGVSEDDRRWDDHGEYCDGCDLCRDSVPIILFRGEGANTEQAQFHEKCFESIGDFVTVERTPAAGAAPPTEAKK